MGGCSVAGAELRLGDVSQGTLDLLQKHVPAVHHLLQTGGCIVVLFLQLPQTGRLMEGTFSTTLLYKYSMNCTIEKVLSDAKSLVERLRNHDNAAEMLIEQTTSLNKRVEAMQQYQEEIDSLNQVARHRPRSSLVLGIQQENRQIRDLQQENKELRSSLEEHQSALELIMTKYREQVFRLLMASKRDDPTIVTQLKEQHTTEMQAHIDKINEMASVMRKAIEVDEGRICEDEERIKQLELENSGLRELLGISREAFLVLKREETSESTSLSPLLTSADVSLRKNSQKILSLLLEPSQGDAASSSGDTC
ncbi:hypothetical protein F7725_021800, partial [Dissostichus mawsoni]